MKTMEAARGKWAGILNAFGIDDSHLRNLHGPCPVCSGNDRFRFDDKDGMGTFFCNGCGAGNGMDLLMAVKGWDFKTAASEVDKIAGNIQSKPVLEKQDDRKRMRWIMSTLDKNDSINPVRLYLKSRALPYSKALMFHPSIRYFHDGNLIDVFPAMVAAFRNVHGQLINLHLTHLTSKGEKANVPAVKKFLSPLEKMNGGAIRLTQTYSHIGVSEGIETALAVMKSYRIPCWATGTAGLLESFEPPEGVEKVTVFADNDASYTGQAAAYALAKRLHLRKFDINVMIPEFIGDFADEVTA